MFRSFDGTRLTTRWSILICPAVITSSPARQRRAVVLPQPDGPTRTRNSPSLISRSRSLTATTSSAYALVTWSKVTLAMGAETLLRQRFGAKPLEMGDQLLTLRQKSSLLQHARADAALDALDKRPVLAPDLVVEGDQLVDPGLVDARREEVVQEARRALGADGKDRAAREVRPAGEDVDPEVRPEEVELAPNHLPVGQKGVAVLAERPELAGRQAGGLEAVRIGRHVDGGREAGMCDRAVVALRSEERRVGKEGRARGSAERSLRKRGSA